MIREIYGKKIGMTQIFDEEGNLLAATLVEVEPVCVLEKAQYATKTKARIGFFKIQENRVAKVKKPIKGYFDKLEISPYKFIKEVDIEKDADFTFNDPKEEAKEETKKEAVKEENKEQENKEENKEQGQNEQVKADEPKETGQSREIGIEIFKQGETIDVRAKSKGKGFAGGMKRHGWSGQPGSHGSTSHRRIGSAGASAYPSRIIKGLHMPGHMGDCFRTTKNLKILKIDKDKNILFIEGSVPGSRGTIVNIKKVK